MIKAEFFKRRYFGGSTHYARVDGVFYFWDDAHQGWERSYSQLESYRLYMGEAANGRVIFGKVKWGKGK